MSLTGSNADNRVLVKPSEQGVAIAHLYSEVTGGSANIRTKCQSEESIVQSCCRT
jgi:hypothetical protein